MRRKNTTIGFAVLLVVIGLYATFFASGVLAAKNETPSHVGAKADLGVYSDSACTQSLTSTDWGIVSPGYSVNRTVYVKNLGSVPLRLSLVKTNLNPATVDGPIALNWNLDGAVLAVGQVKSATLTLSVSSSASGFTTFSVDAVISGQAVRGRPLNDWRTVD